MSIGSILSTATLGLQNSARTVRDAAHQIAGTGTKINDNDDSAQTVGTHDSEATGSSSQPTKETNLVSVQEFRPIDSVIDEFVRIRQAETVYQASAALIKSAVEISETLLNEKT